MTENTKPAVLITGGNTGIGLAIAKAYSMQNYTVAVTTCPGSENPDELSNQFTNENLELPLVLQSGFLNDDDITSQMEIIREKIGTIDVLISAAKKDFPVTSLDDYLEEEFLNSIESCSWPIVNYPRLMKKILGRYPGYVIGISSGAIDTVIPGYDFNAANQHLMEIMVRYLNHHFYPEGIIFNIVRTPPILSGSGQDKSDTELSRHLEDYDRYGPSLSPDEFAKTLIMLTSGMMDSIRGQTINADRGFSFAAGMFGLYNVKLS